MTAATVTTQEGAQCPVAASQPCTSAAATPAPAPVAQTAPTRCTTTPSRSDTATPPPRPDLDSPTAGPTGAAPGAGDTAGNPAEIASPSDQGEIETRYFIGLMPEGWHLSVIAGPGRFDGPYAPHTLGDTDLFPVSEAVCREWTADVEDDEPDADGEVQR